MHWAKLKKYFKNFALKTCSFKSCAVIFAAA
jgi:hypothetical protein